MLRDLYGFCFINIIRIDPKNDQHTIRRGDQPNLPFEHIDYGDRYGKRDRK